MSSTKGEHVVEVSTGLTVMEGVIIIYLVLMLTAEVRVHAQPVMFTFTLIGLKTTSARTHGRRHARFCL